MPPIREKTARELLDFYLEAGADTLVGEEPVDRFAAVDPPPPARAPQPVSLPPDLETKGRASPYAAPQAPDDAAMAARRSKPPGRSMSCAKSYKNSTAAR